MNAIFRNKQNKKNMLYYLTNKMSLVENSTHGRILSVHQSWEAAENAHSKLQKQVAKSNGANSYLPTKIVRSNKRFLKGGFMPWSF